ncbi:hypothetical protein SASPL_156795 [Salvia splendens]|uniref:Uncharacterized protein n=1 Tax=Salvia splendens TaxID=180675 RepID=A0A8X8VW23_SALSN|nr:hypothetical protein SASPL_156795 [Salvia splendens]
MAGSNEVNANESKGSDLCCKDSIFTFDFEGFGPLCFLSLAYFSPTTCSGDRTAHFNRDLNEFLDRKVPANAVPVDGVYSFDVVDRATSLINRVYLAAGDTDAPGGSPSSRSP